MLFVNNGYEYIGLVFLLFEFYFYSIYCVGTEAMQVLMVAEGSSRKRN